MPIIVNASSIFFTFHLGYEGFLDSIRQGKTLSCIDRSFIKQKILVFYIVQAQKKRYNVSKSRDRGEPMTRLKPSLALIVSLSLLLMFAAGLYAGRSASGSSTPEPGSAADPLVSQSYLQAYVAQHAGSGGGEGGSSFTIVEVKPGETLQGVMGTELILRAGNAEAVGNSAGDGISNITLGKDMKNKEKLPLNQLLIVPRADGRGALVPSSSGGSAIFMVRGQYSIQ
jgi:hypothetical protein